MSALPAKLRFVALLTACVGLWLPLQTAWAAAPARSAVLQRCSWDSPGTNPYQGELAAAVDDYSDIPAATRAALKTRIAAQRYDDIAVIGRGHITGQWAYSAELRDMHFGNGRMCRIVTRQRWAANAEERGLVYCEGAHCIIVPTVCRNVSRVTRRPSAASAAPAGDGGTASRPLALLPDSTELQFDAPSAGRALASDGEPLPWTGPQTLTLMGLLPDGTLAPAAVLAPAPVATAGLAPVEAGLPGTVAAPTAVPVDLNGGGSFAAGSNPGGAGPGGVPSAAPTTFVPRPLDPLQPGLGGGGLLTTGQLTATAPVPEPSTTLLMAVGLVVLVWHSSRRR